jgi:hypothetical protein
MKMMKTLLSMTIEEFNARINQSLKDSAEGNLIESTDLKAMIDSWS